MHRRLCSVIPNHEFTREKTLHESESYTSSRLISTSMATHPIAHGVTRYWQTAKDWPRCPTVKFAERGWKQP